MVTDDGRTAWVYPGEKLEDVLAEQDREGMDVTLTDEQVAVLPDDLARDYFTAVMNRYVDTDLTQYSYWLARAKAVYEYLKDPVRWMERNDSNNMALVTQRNTIKVENTQWKRGLRDETDRIRAKHEVKAKAPAGR